MGEPKEEDSEAFLARMDHAPPRFYMATIASSVRDLREERPRPSVARLDSEDFKGLRELLVEENNTLEHLSLGQGGYHKAEGFLEAAVSKLSSLQIWGKEEFELDFGEEEISSFDDAVAAAKDKGMPIKLKTLSLQNCKVDIDALAGSALPKCLEHLQLLCCKCSLPPLDSKLLRDPACTIWELSTDAKEVGRGLFQAGSTSLRKLVLDKLPIDQALLRQICESFEGLEVFKLSKLFRLAACLNNANSKIRFLKLDPFSPELFIEPVCQLLESPYCKLEGFSWNLPFAFEQERILSSLEANYSSRIQRLNIHGRWESKVLEDRWLRVQRRNALFQKSPLLAQRAPVTPSTAKLFMCGHTGSGKTTISTNLVRPCAALRQCVKPLRQDQDQASTVGIERRTLRFGERKKLLVYDLGGQEVYHAFHHYFLRGSDKDLFLVVCKVGGPLGSDLETELQYWLRFIAAHQSATPVRKPTVFLVLNVSVPDNRNILVESRTAATTLIQKYEDILDFVDGQDGNRYFEVNGLNAYQVQKELKHQLETAVDEMLNEVPVIPWTCDEVIRRRASSTPWYHIRTQAQTIVQQRVVQLHEMSKAWFKQEKQDQAFAAEYTFICLHDMGEVVYFGADDAYQNRDPNDKEAALIVNNAVLDMPWFLQQVLGVFIPQQERHDTTKHGTHRWSIELAKQHLKAIGESEAGNIYFLLKLLCEMGVLIPGDTNWPRSWSDPQNLPKDLIVPALLTNTFPGWAENQQTCYCWGRRLQPENTMKDFVLLPSGVFGVIQAKVKEMCDKCGHGNRLGAGWVFFQEDHIQVLVTVGGDYKHWTDRQWVDIMLMVPKEEKRGLKGEQIMKEIRDCVVTETSRACPFIKLQEHVLNPREVRLFGIHTKLERPCSEDRKSSWSLEEVKQRVVSEGFDYFFTWGLGDDTSGWELLMPTEANKIIESSKHALEEVITEYNQHIVPVYQKGQQQLMQLVEIPHFESNDMNMLASFCYKLHKQHEESMGTYMEDIKDSIQKLQKSLKDTENALIKSCSSLLSSVKLQCPKLPHLTLKANVLLRYSRLFGKQANIHYLCEHSRHNHPVDLEKYPGVEITVPHVWFKNYGNTLVPGITICFILARLGKVALPVGGELVGTLIELGEEGLKAATKSCFGGNLDSTLKPTSENDILKLFEYVKKNAPPVYGDNRSLMMEECFGLYQSTDGWVCKDHR